MTQLTKKQAIAFIVALGVVCIGLGVASGMVIERRRAEKYFCGMGGTHFMRSFPKAGSFMHRGSDVMHKGGGFMHKSGRFSPKEGLREKRKGAGEVCERIGRKLDLSSEQQQKVEAVLEASRQEVAQASEAFKTQLESIKEKSNTQILELLSPEQQKKFQGLGGGIREKMGRGYRGMMQ